MSEVIYYVATSLDGFVATPDGGVDWLSEFEGSAEDYGYNDFYASIEALLIGRRTFEQVLTFGDWPYPGKPTWVFSRRPLVITPPDVALADVEPKKLLAELADIGLHRFWLVGGASLSASFRTQGLITEFIVSIMPVILGDGIPLFAPGGPEQRLTLLQSEKFNSGVIQLRYGKISSA
jgi:dihydrofolate reductase